MNNELISKVLDNRPVMIVVMLGTAAGAVISVAAGFRIVYQLVTWIGA